MTTSFEDKMNFMWDTIQISYDYITNEIKIAKQNHEAHFENDVFSKTLDYIKTQHDCLKILFEADKTRIARERVRG